MSYGRFKKFNVLRTVQEGQSLRLGQMGQCPTDGSNGSMRLWRVPYCSIVVVYYITLSIYFLLFWTTNLTELVTFLPLAVLAWTCAT